MKAFGTAVRRADAVGQYEITIEYRQDDGRKITVLNHVVQSLDDLETAVHAQLAALLLAQKDATFSQAVVGKEVASLNESSGEITSDLAPVDVKGVQP